MDDHPDAVPSSPSWQVLMEALVTGAVRGMAEAHEQLAQDCGAPPLNELALFQAAELLVALLLEDSGDCADRAGFPAAADMTRRHVLAHLESFRRRRERAGEAPLVTILERAGLGRHGIS